MGDGGGGAKIQNIGGQEGATLIAGCKLIEESPPFPSPSNHCQIITFLTFLKTDDIANLTFNARMTTAADDIHKYFFIVFQRK